MKLNILRRPALFVLAVFLAGCSTQPLYSSLDEQQANEVTAALEQSNLHAQKREGKDKTWQVEVPRGEFPAAMQVLNARGLPRQSYGSMCDIFKKEGFSSSATEERGRYLCGLQQELARTISAIPGVVDARVHIALPEKDVLGVSPGHASASVVVYQQPDANVTNRETDIKVIVKDGVEGLDDLNKVTVKFFTMPPPAATASRGWLAMIDIPQLLAWVAGVVAVLIALRMLLPRLRGGSPAPAVLPPQRTVSPMPAQPAPREVTLGEQMNSLIDELRNQ